MSDPNPTARPYAKDQSKNPPPKHAFDRLLRRFARAYRALPRRARREAWAAAGADAEDRIGRRVRWPGHLSSALNRWRGRVP